MSWEDEIIVAPDQVVDVRPGEQVLVRGIERELTNPPPVRGIRITLWGKRDVPIAMYDLMPPGNLYADLPFLLQIKDQVTRVEATWM